jgi:hypothetical protein
MLALAREQQAWAREMFNVFKGGISEGDTSEMRLMQNTLNEQQKMLDLSSPLKQRAMTEIAPAYMDKVIEGIDVGEKMDQAQADVAQGFETATGATMRAAARRGLNPNDINFNKIATERARQTGFARTRARTLAEDETFKRLSDAMRMKSWV